MGWENEKEHSDDGTAGADVARSTREPRGRCGRGLTRHRPGWRPVGTRSSLSAGREAGLVRPDLALDETL